MSALGLVGYGYDDDDDEEDDEGLADELKYRERERPDGTAERPLLATELDRDRVEEEGKQAAEQRNTQNGADPMPYESQVPEGTVLGEATPPAPVGDVPMVEHSPKEQQANEEGDQCMVPTAPPWSVPGIPDAPENKCDEKWQNRIVWVLEQQKRTGKQMVTEMQRNKSYRNPRFMQKHIEEKTVNQYGTCFPVEVWDPSSLRKEDFLYRIRRDMRELDKVKRAKVAANTAAKAATQRLHPASMPASAARASAVISGTKRSKWDQTR